MSLLLLPCNTHLIEALTGSFDIINGDGDVSESKVGRVINQTSRVRNAIFISSTSSSKIIRRSRLTLCQDPGFHWRMRSWDHSQFHAAEVRKESLTWVHVLSATVCNRPLTLWVSSRIPSLANLDLALSPLERCASLEGGNIAPISSVLFRLCTSCMAVCKTGRIARTQARGMPGSIE